MPLSHSLEADHNAFFCKETKNYTFQKIILVSNAGPLKLWTTPIALHIHAPSHTDSPPEAPNQFLLFSNIAWTCSGRQRHSFIRRG